MAKAFVLNSVFNSKLQMMCGVRTCMSLYVLCMGHCEFQAGQSSRKVWLGAFHVTYSWEFVNH